jgi:glycosyltransferase involved in cell wall biosynthesis
VRILQVSDFYPPSLGGLERHVQTLARTLVARDHDVAVATLWHDGSPAFELDQGVRVHRLKGWNHLLRPLYEDADHMHHLPFADPGVMRGLRKLLDREQPDVVHARGWMLYSLLPFAARRKLQLVVTLHDYGLVCAKKTGLCGERACDGPAYLKCLHCAMEQLGLAKSLIGVSGLRASRRLHARVDRFLAISQAVHAASIPGLGRPPRPIEVVPTFIPDSAVEDAAMLERPGFLPPEDNYLLFVGALGVHKGINVLLDAYVHGLGQGVPLVIIGIDRADAPKAFPAGAIVVRNASHPQVMAAWRHCALGIIPSIWPEPFGQVAIEAMACGRPVVASAVGGLRDAVVDGETGILVPPRDPVALSAAVRSLLADPERRASMGRAARDRARRFMASTVTARIEEVYREVAKAAPA